MMCADIAENSRDRALVLVVAGMKVSHSKLESMSVGDVTDDLKRPLWKPEYDPYLNLMHWVREAKIEQSPAELLWQSIDRWGNVRGGLSNSGLRYILSQVQARAGVEILSWKAFCDLT